MHGNKCQDNRMIVSGTKGKDVRRLNPAEMKLGQGDSYAALRGKSPKQNHSIKGELVPLATSVVQKCKTGEMDEELTCGIKSNSILYLCKAVALKKRLQKTGGSKEDFCKRRQASEVSSSDEESC